MKVPYTYYRHLLDRLSGRVAQLRYIIIDRIFVWAELQRAQAMQHLAAADTILHPSNENPYVEPLAEEDHNCMGYDHDGQYHCKCGETIHGDTVPELKANWSRHRRRVYGMDLTQFDHQRHEFYAQQDVQP